MFVQVLQQKPYSCQNSHDAEFYISASESLKKSKGHQITFYISETNYSSTLCMKRVGPVWLDFSFFKYYLFCHLFSHPYEKLLIFDKVKNNTEFLIQSARETSQETDGAMNTTYIASTFLPVHIFGGFATQFGYKPIFKKFRYFRSFLLWLALSLFSVDFNFIFFLQIIFFLPSFLLQSVVLSLQPRKHSVTHLYSNFSTQTDVQKRWSFLMCQSKDPKAMLAGT